MVRAAVAVLLRFVVTHFGAPLRRFVAPRTGLGEEWTYWIIISATDEDGRREYVTGNITTPRIDDDVVVAFAAIDVIYDGDKGRNKGELTFDWNLGTEEVGRNGEYHRGDGSRIDLDEQDSSRVLFDVEGVLPVLQVRGLETDPRGGLEFCSAGPDQGGYGTDEDCGYAWNSTLPFEPTIDDISLMSDCDVFDIGELYDGYRCTRLQTNEPKTDTPAANTSFTDFPRVVSLLARDAFLPRQSHGEIRKARENQPETSNRTHRRAS